MYKHSQRILPATADGWADCDLQMIHEDLKMHRGDAHQTGKG